MTPARREARAKAKAYAAAALRAVVRGDDWDAAAAALQQASDELGGTGMNDIILLLCDTNIAAQDRMRGTPGAPPPATARAVWVNPETGRVDDADGVPPDARWAGQVLAARAAMDLPAYEALLSALPQNPTQHIARLLSACAMTVRVEAEGKEQEEREQ